MYKSYLYHDTPEKDSIFHSALPQAMAPKERQHRFAFRLSYCERFIIQLRCIANSHRRRAMTPRIMDQEGHSGPISALAYPPWLDRLCCIMQYGVPELSCFNTPVL